MHSKTWSLGSRVLCLNQESRPDRWEQALKEFNRVGITPERFLSIPADQPNKSFCMSQYAMLKAFLDGDGDVLMCFEDDAVFKKLDHLDAAVAELPKDWDILYLGANITDGVFGIKENPPQKYSEHLFRIRKAWTTHALAYSRKMVETIVNFYPVGDFHMFDNWLNEYILPRYKCFLVNPMICFQRPGHSDLWGNATDYTGAFDWGNKFMQA